MQLSALGIAVCGTAALALSCCVCCVMMPTCWRLPLVGALRLTKLRVAGGALGHRGRDTQGQAVGRGKAANHVPGVAVGGVQVGLGSRPGTRAFAQSRQALGLMQAPHRAGRAKSPRWMCCWCSRTCLRRPWQRMRCALAPMTTVRQSCRGPPPAYAHPLRTCWARAELMARARRRGVRPGCRGQRRARGRARGRWHGGGARGPA